MSTIFAKSSILDVRLGSEYASVLKSLGNKYNSSWKPLSIFAKSSILDVSLGSEYDSLYKRLHIKENS